MKVKNKRVRGGKNPLFECPCGRQIDPQSKGPRPVAGQGKFRMLYHASDCGAYMAVK